MCFAGVMDFGSYVRNAREARHLTFDEVSAQTKIKTVFWSDLEANDLQRWPREQIYRRGYLRSYAAAIGLDPDDVLSRFAEQFAERPGVVGHPEGVEPPPVERKPRTSALPQLLKFRTNAVLPLLLIGMGAFAFREGKTQDSMPGQKPATPVTRGGDVGQPQPEVPAMRLIATGGSPEAARAVPAEPGVVDAQPIATTEAMEGTLVVESDPPDAFITINGIGRGKSPVKVEYLALGSYTIRVVQPGYRSAEKRVVLDSTNPRKAVKLDLLPVS